jgi:hypothetical protein
MTDAASVPADAPQPSGEAVKSDLEPGGRALLLDATTSGTASAPTGLDGAGRPWPPFAHGSEAEMARILDFYEVRWEYEPRTFPILWNLDGDVVESFSPDFYLPDLDLYLEMTTLRQRLVRKKNRKLRRLRELYPAIRIKLFYARDFRAMLLKYGRLALADSLSGTVGQVMPDRSRDDDLAIDLVIDGDPVLPGPMVEDLRATPADTPEVVSEAPLPAALEAVALEADGRRTAASTAGAPAASRRNASRSRRRRAAAAARRASRAAGAEAPKAASSGRQAD